MNGKNKLNKTLYQISLRYWPAIPVGEIMNAIETAGGLLEQEDGTAWSGLLCGETGRMNAPVSGLAERKKYHLELQWYKMPSGNYEINCYIS